MIKKIDTFIGIDPGKNGGIAYLTNGRIHASKMPSTLDELKSVLEYIHDNHKNPCVFVETVQAWTGDDDSPGKKFGINKMLKSYNQIESTLTFVGLPFVPVYPVSWQTTCGLLIRGSKETKTERKNRFKDYAQNLFPELNITLATSDAVCLVQSGLMKYQLDPDWIWSRIQNNAPAKLF